MLYILVVLYNKTIETSATLQGLLGAAHLLNEHNCKVVIHDNSPLTLSETAIDLLQESFHQFDYVHSESNEPLSVIYNRAITNSIAGNASYLIILDDDSKVDKHFFELAIQHSSTGYNLMLPVIRHNGIIRSPMKYYIFKSLIFKNVPHGIISSKNLMAINSGMIISVKFINSFNFRYDEQLMNYGTDNYFMRFYSQHSSTVFMLDYVLDHSLSFFDTNNIERKLKVFREIKKANLIVHSDNLIDKTLALSFNILTSIKYAIVHRSLRFLK